MDQVGVFSDPTQASGLSPGSFEDRSGVDVGARGLGTRPSLDQLSDQFLELVKQPPVVVFAPRITGDMTVERG